MQAETTIIVATRGRPHHAAAQLRLLRSRLDGPIVVADSSADHDHVVLGRLCGGLAEVRRFPPTLSVFAKLREAVAGISSPFTVLLPDDDVTFPHAIGRCLADLAACPDAIAAHGYVLNFGFDATTFDLRAVKWFTPSILDQRPLRRVYDLMRRYQCFFWGAFRTPALGAALRLVDESSWPLLLQEWTFMNAAVLQGKFIRVPTVFTLRGMEESQTPLGEQHPLYAILHDAGAFTRGYLAYRNRLAAFARSLGVAGPAPRVARLADTPGGPLLARMADGEPATLEQALDLFHAITVQRELDSGVLNHAAQILLDEGKAPMRIDPQWSGVRPVARGDIVRHSARPGRRYVWRREVLEAEPRSEIEITPAERVEVERALDLYAL